MIKAKGSEREIFIMEQDSSFIVVMVGREEQHIFGQKYASYEQARIQANNLCKLFESTFVERG